MLNVHSASKIIQKKRTQQKVKNSYNTWEKKYKKSVQPLLLEKYNRRINSFILRLQEDKKQLYEYRIKTESNARMMLKEISHKQKFLGDQTIKLRDVSDWNSMLPAAERIQKQKNKVKFQKRFGDANIAYRSIGSQSVYYPKGSNLFRERNKDKQLHDHSMRFTSKRCSFSQNKIIVQKINKSSSNIVDQKSFALKRRSTTASSYMIEDDRSSEILKNSNMTQEQDKSSVHKQQKIHHLKEPKGNSAKVYFKQIVDFEQNICEKTAKLSLHKILVRFGITRIKDMKKQAMMETDCLQTQQL